MILAGALYQTHACYDMTSANQCYEITFLRQNKQNKAAKLHFLCQILKGKANIIPWKRNSFMLIDVENILMGLKKGNI